MIKRNNLIVLEGKVDVVLDTNAYNEIDDQFAIANLLLSKDKLNTKAIYAAPFYNSRSSEPAGGMEKSYKEILKLMNLMHEKVDVFRGFECYLPDEKTPAVSPAAKDLAKRAIAYSEEPWLLNDNNCFMQSKITPIKLPASDGHYIDETTDKIQRYVYYIHRDNLIADLIKKISSFQEACE